MQTRQVHAVLLCWCVTNMHQSTAGVIEMVTAEEPTMSQKNDRTQCVRSLKNLISLGDAHGPDDCLGNLGAGGRSWLDAVDDVVWLDVAVVQVNNLGTDTLGLCTDV